MNSGFSRRQLLQSGGLGVLALSTAAKRALAQAPAPVVPNFAGNLGCATVSLAKGDDRRNNVYQSLMAIDHQLAPQLKRKSYVVIKPNNVSTSTQLASTHIDALRGILDYVGERFHGDVIIAESSAGNTLEGFEAFGYSKLVSEYRKHKLSLLDLNTEGRYLPEVARARSRSASCPCQTTAARLQDPEAFVFCSAMLKTHNTVVATLSIKNMLKVWARLDDLRTRSAQQRNCVLHPEFVDGQYAFYTRAQDSFIEAGRGGGIGWGLAPNIEHAVIAEDETILDRREYHTINEVKNGPGTRAPQDGEGLASPRSRRPQYRGRPALRALLFLCDLKLPIR